MKNTLWPSESTLAMNDFAAWVRRNRSRLNAMEQYEVHPCRKVRGVMLRLPVVGWRFWFPSVAEAVSFTRRMAPIYGADCAVYDAAGHRCAVKKNLPVRPPILQASAARTRETTPRNDAALAGTTAA